MPLFKLSRDVSGIGTVSIPRLIIHGWQAAMGIVPMTLMRVSGSGTFDGVGTGAITFPRLRVSGSGIADAVVAGAGTGTVALPSLLVSGTGGQGEGSGSGTISLPLLSVSGRGRGVDAFDFGDETDGVLRYEPQRRLI